jgi:imidazoleglycerol-phosphate dehydratase
MTTTPRTATRERATRETTIRVRVDLDGSGRSEIATGVGFYDHLLTSLAHHSMIDIEVAATGDLHIDEHHTVEDVALVLGDALSAALGDRAGIMRFGDAVVPMDDALASVALDLSGRPYAVLDLAFRGEKVGALSTQLVEHILESLARTLGANLNVRASGRNDHHIAEAVFKGLARSLRAAVAIDPRRTGIASTKGTLG